MTEKYRVEIGQLNYCLSREKIASLCAEAETLSPEDLERIAEIHECRDVDELKENIAAMRRAIEIG